MATELLNAYPKHWIKGQLLDLKRFNNGTFKASLMGDEAKTPETLDFSSRDAAQEFVSWWYSREPMFHVEHLSTLENSRS